MFRNLDKAKQNRILNAAYKEFSEQGYVKASTNQIVKEAEIGKGMLFYYFKSKNDLYNYLIDTGIDFVMEEYFGKIDEDETDLLKKYKQISKLKMQAFIDNPYVFQFLSALYINEEMQLSEDLLNRLLEVRKLAYAKVYQKIDTTLFRDFAPQDNIFKLIQWTLDGYEKELVNRLKGQKLSSVDMNPLWEEFDELLDVLRKIYYK